MPIDPSIALGFKQPDQTQQLSSLLGVANSAQTLQQNQQKTQQTGIDLQERQAMQRVMSDPTNYTDPQGNFDPMKAQQNIMRAAPTTGTKYWQEIASAHKMSTEATSALNTLTAQNRSVIGGALASLPADAPKELVHKTVDALNDQFGGRIGPLVDVFKRGYENASKGGPKAATDYVLQSARSVLPQETQQSMNTPSVMTLDNGQQTVGVNVKPGVQGIPQGAPVQGTMVQKVLPPGQQEGVTTDTFGNQFVTQRDPHGNVLGTRPLQSANPAAPGPMNFPPGESKDTFDVLNQQRAAAQEAARGAGTMHDLNRTIAAEVNKGINTGSLGALTQKMASATGYSLGTGESSTDYNVLGKMLERSALSAAQSMGPHTNAGLEAAVRANGSLEYTPQALKKIAYLNDALVTGSELYSQGLEAAIKGSPNTVFAKRDFDREWGKAATPQALRLKNAVDTGNKEEIDAITKEVGGRGTKGATQLHSQLRKLLDLAGH